MRPTVVDGAMGTELAIRGIRVDGPAWSARALVEAPDAVAAIHAAYAAAGATVHTANTFRATRRALASWVDAPRGLVASDLARTAVELARAAAAEGHLVAGSLASVADCYATEAVASDVRLEHRESAEVLARAGADLILCETFAHGGEAVAAVEEAVRTGLPVWLALTAGPRADLLAPVDARAIAERAVAAGAGAVLVNCTAATATRPYVEALAGLGVAVGAYANAGAPDDALGHLVDWGGPHPGAETLLARAERYADLAEGWVAAGATLVGGCCGTGPAHVEALARRWGGRGGHIPAGSAY